MRKCLNDVDYKFIYPSDSAPVKIYVYPKMHKLADSVTLSLSFDQLSLL